MEKEIDRDNEQFNQGVTHTVEILAKALGIEDWIAGDGSEDYDDDLQQTLMNILIAKGLYDEDTGLFSKPAASFEQRLAALEKNSHEPVDFTDIYDRLDKLDGGLAT